MRKAVKGRDPFKTPWAVKHPLLFWCREHLFSSPLNAVLTLLSCFLIFQFCRLIGKALFSWDWNILKVNLKVLIAGSYPEKELWRVWICFGYAGFLFLISFFALRLVPARIRAVTLCVGWLLFLPFMFIIISGFGGPLPRVKTNYWGGLLLSLLISLTSIFLSLPIGLFLALGRRSSLWLVKGFCTGFIELVRGVPLVTILFIGYLILPMALPPGLSPSMFIRALVGFIMFQSAYIAEAFRGGLQGISRTQYEAAWSLNLNPVKTMAFVILPQVFKRMLPVLVNCFTGALKDTSLISIIGMLDMVGIATALLNNPQNFPGSIPILFFEGFVYFVLCYSISRSSRSLEKKLGVGPLKTV